MTSEAEPLSPGTVVLVPFPFTDQSGAKRRPAVVISSIAYNAVWPDLILMPVTSQLRASAVFGEVWLQDWSQSGLLKPSAVKPVIATFEQRLILRVMGTLSERDCDALHTSLELILANPHA